MSLWGEELWTLGPTDTGRMLCENEAEAGVMLPNPQEPPGTAGTEAQNRLSSEALERTGSAGTWISDFRLSEP